MPCDYADYHPKWQLIRRLIRRRAGAACEWCKARDGAPHPLTGFMVHLATAHLDHNPAHNRFHNLACLCQRCHLNHDRARQVYNRRFGLPYVPGKHPRAGQQLTLELPAGVLYEAFAQGRVQLLPPARWRQGLIARPVRVFPRPQLLMPFPPAPLLTVAPLTPQQLAQRRAATRLTLARGATPAESGGGAAAVLIHSPSPLI